MTQSRMTQKGYELAEMHLKSAERKIISRFIKTRSEVDAILKDTYARFLTGVPKEDYKIVMGSYNRLKKMDKKIQGVYMSFYGGNYPTAKGALKSAFTENYYRQQYSSMIFSGKQGFNPLNPMVTEYAVTGETEQLMKMSQALRDRAKPIVSPSGQTLSTILAGNGRRDVQRILQTIHQGINSGEAYTNVARKLKDVFDGSASNAIRVVRTEGNRTMNASAYWNAEELDVPMQKLWVATLGGDTRDSHQALDLQVVGMEETFKSGGGEALYPGQFGIPSEDIFCRCSVSYIVDGVHPQARRGIDPTTGKSTIGEYENYNEWLERGRKGEIKTIPFSQERRQVIDEINKKWIVAVDGGEGGVRGFSTKKEATLFGKQLREKGEFANVFGQETFSRYMKEPKKLL